MAMRCCNLRSEGLIGGWLWEELSFQNSEGKFQGSLASLSLLLAFERCWRISCSARLVSCQDGNLLLQQQPMAFSKISLEDLVPRLHNKSVDAYPWC